jgi:hypothetical protein
MKEFRVTQADNGGFVITDSNPYEPYKAPGTIAAVSSARDLIQVIAGIYDVSPTKVEDVTPPNWQVNKYESQPPFLNGTEIVVIWQDGTETYSQPFTVFSRDWDKVAMWRITKGLPYMANEPAWDKAPDGWIEWKGGEPPAIAKGTPIMVRQRHGLERTTTMGKAFTFNAFWRNDNCEEDIVAYKVVTPVPPIARSYNNDSGHGEPLWIEWKGGEPPAIADPIMVRFRNGEEHETNVRNMRWSHTGSIADIVAYKVCD